APEPPLAPLHRRSRMRDKVVPEWHDNCCSSTGLCPRVAHAGDARITRWSRVTALGSRAGARGPCRMHAGTVTSVALPHPGLRGVVAVSAAVLLGIVLAACDDEPVLAPWLGGSIPVPPVIGELAVILGPNEATIAFATDQP